MAMKHIISGAIVRRLFFVEMAAFAVVTAAVGFSAHQALDERRALDGRVQATAADAEPDPELSCFSGSKGPDALPQDPSYNCFRMGGGPEHLDLAQITEDLVIEISRSSISGAISAGQGDDTIHSGQWGLLDAGAGDDDIVVNLQHPADDRQTLDIHPGPGRDTLDLSFLPGVTARGRVQTGPGALRAGITCGDGHVDLGITPGSSSVINGRCPLSAKTSGSSGERTSLRLWDGIFLDADLFGIESLELDVSVSNSNEMLGPQSVRLGPLRYGELRYKAKSVAPVSFALEAGDLSPSTSVLIDIAAPDGELRLQGGARESWSVQAHYSQGGRVTLAYPPTSDFTAMTFPDLKGKAKTLTITGCFDEVMLLSGRGKTLRMEGCSKIGEANIRIPPEDGIHTLALIRSGKTARLRLGAGGLDISFLELRRAQPALQSDVLPRPVP